MEYVYYDSLVNKLHALEALEYTDVYEITGWESRTARYTAPGVYKDYCPWKPVERGFVWYAKSGDTRFFRAKVQVPAQLKGKQTVLYTDVGGEGLLTVNGEIRSGLSSSESRIMLSGCMRADAPVPDCGELRIEIEAGLNYGEFYGSKVYPQEFGRTASQDEATYTLRNTFVAARDPLIWSYCCDLRVALDALRAFEDPFGKLKDSSLRRNALVETLVRAGRSYERIYDCVRDAVLFSLQELDFDFSAPRLRAGVEKAQKILRERLQAADLPGQGSIILVGQAHIDTAWLWPFKESVRKVTRTFANVVKLIQQYPDFVFAFSQPQLFAYLEKEAPQLFEQVRQYVKSGNIELVGNAWVEMDANLPAGESLVRQLLYGRAYYLEKFGKCSDVFWMPDVFGYCWALPQIMARSGIPYFFTTKLLYNDTNNFPHSLFMWQGMDGTRVLSYLQRLGYDNEVTPQTVKALYDGFDQKSVCPQALLTYGYGDGGGGPTEQMVESARRLQAFPGMPRAKLGSSLQFFEDAQKVQVQLPVWKDEMYFEYHRGTYTSQAYIKKMNRTMELGLRRLEIICSMAMVLCGRDYPWQAIDELWRGMLTLQFHDVLPGSSIKEVYDDCKKEYARLSEQVLLLQQQGMACLSRYAGGKRVWNFLSFDRQAPSMGFAKLPQQQRQLPTAENNVLENSRVRVEFDADGRISGIFDKRRGIQVLAQPSNALCIFEDKAHVESGWNLEREYRNKCWPLTCRSIRCENGTVTTVLQFNKSVVTQTIRLLPDSEVVYFQTHVDWREREKLLKSAFYPDVLSSRATYEIQFGAIERPTHENTSYDKAKFEVCGHRWADLSEPGSGAAILNDSKYGYDIQDNCMRITLLRGPVCPDEYADLGEHDFTYAFYPHEKDWREAGVVQQAHSLNEPELFTQSEEPGLADAYSFAGVNVRHVVLDTVKRAQDGRGLILRVYESEGQRGSVHLHLGFAATGFWETNLMEQDETPLTANGDGFDFYCKPFEIKTFRVLLADEKAER